MNLETVLETVAQTARTRRLMEAYYETRTDPDTLSHPVLMGYCYENARELSYDLYQHRIPHRIVYGGIAYDSIGLSPTTEKTAKAHENPDIDKYIDDGDSGRIDPALWDETPKPTMKQEIPDEANHYWIEVDGKETVFRNHSTYHVEIAAEAREHYNQVFIQEGHPSEFYIKPEDDCYVSPWESDSEWTWNPETLDWLQ